MNEDPARTFDSEKRKKKITCFSSPNKMESYENEQQTNVVVTGKRLLIRTEIAGSCRQ
jgi:hypothetical protein